MTPTKQTVAGAPERVNHKRFIPWTLTRDTNYSPFAHALRAWSTFAQTGRPDPKHGFEKLKAYLDEHDLVVDYRRYDGGFFLVPRDPAVDDPDLPICMDYLNE